MIDEMHRRSNRLARVDPSKYNNFINKKINEPTFKTTDTKLSSTEREKSKEKSSASGKRVRCDICGYKNHETANCFHSLRASRKLSRPT
jgi:hypothetical protein